MKRKSTEWRNARIAHIDEGSGPPVVFIHGFPTASFLWEKVVAKLAGSFRCVAPDLMGLGYVEAPPEMDLGMESQAETILGLMDSLGIKKAAIIAHDQGGAAAQIIATNHASRTTALVLADSVAYDNWPVPGVRFIYGVGSIPFLGSRIVTSPILRSLATKFGRGIETGFHDPSALTDAMRNNFNRVGRSASARADYLRFIRAMDNRCTVEAAASLGAIRVPTMIVWGDHDRLINVRWGNRLVNDIPDAKGPVLIKDCGHFSPLESPTNSRE